MSIFQKIDFFRRFKGRKLLRSIEHISVKVRWRNSGGVKYYSSWREPIFVLLLKVVD